MSWAAVLLAAAVLAWPQSAKTRLETGLRSARSVSRVPSRQDLLAVAATLDVLGACLHSGMATSKAAAAVSVTAPVQLARPLRRAADLLALGADPAQAWGHDEVAIDRHVEAFLRMARRSAASGSALARGVGELAGDLRAEATDAARARAERASVLIAGPLGLCFLPAFVCLGVVPVVAGLARDVLQSGVM